MSTCNRSPARISRPRISAPGPAPSSPRDSCVRRQARPALAQPGSSWSAPSARVADELGNTAAVAKKGYIHPAVIAAYLSGGLKPIREKDDPDPYKLSAEEWGLLALLGKAA